MRSVCTALVCENYTRAHNDPFWTTESSTAWRYPVHRRANDAQLPRPDWPQRVHLHKSDCSSSERQQILRRTSVRTLRPSAQLHVIYRKYILHNSGSSPRRAHKVWTKKHIGTGNSLTELCRLCTSPIFGEHPGAQLMYSAKRQCCANFQSTPAASEVWEWKRIFERRSSGKPGCHLHLKNVQFINAHFQWDFEHTH